MDGPRPSPAQAGRLGSQVEGRYVLEAELGTGAVGTVYRARDLTADAPVAVKVWHTAHDGQTRGRFVREAQALMTLTHPHIVEVLGAGMLADGTPYVAMEWLQGETLEAVLASTGALNPERVRHLMRQLLSAIAFAHKCDVVHRDLKPDNIFLIRDRSGQEVAKLLDYGLAKFLGADDPTAAVDLTVTGMVMGTPLYMPPEQAAGARVDVRADVYAMGCIAFEMLTGRLPYEGDDFSELVRAHVTAPLPELTDALPNVEPRAELQRFLHTAMAKRPSDRFEHAGRMLASLEAVPRPWFRPKAAPVVKAQARFPALIAASASVLLMAGVALWWWAAR